MSEQIPAPDNKQEYRQKLGVGLILMMIGLYILDQVTKLYIVFNFRPPSFIIDSEGARSFLDQVTVIDGFLNIVRVHNTGVAFGFGNGEPWSVYVFLAVPVIAIALFTFLYRKGFFNTKWLKVAFALLIVGILGNLTDRLIQGFILNTRLSVKMDFWDCIKAGHVIDFIDVRIPFIDWHWPAFNVADSCICIAAVIFLISSFTMSNSDASQPKEQPPQ